MQLHLDENVKRSQADALREAGHDVYEVTRDKNVRNKGVSDANQALEAQKNNRILITQDKDFTALREQKGIPTTGVVYTRASAVDSPDYEKKVVSVLKEHQAALERGAFITVSADKIRVRELNQQRVQEMTQTSSQPIEPKVPREPEKPKSADKPAQGEQPPKPKLEFYRDRHPVQKPEQPKPDQKTSEAQEPKKKLEFYRDRHPDHGTKIKH